MNNIFNMNRLNRLPFFLTNWATGIISNLGVATFPHAPGAGLGIIAFATVLSCFLFTKRLHDMDMSGWCQLVPLGLIFLGFFALGYNVGEPSSQTLLFGGAALIGGFIIYLYIVFTPGTKGPNRFGSDPKASPDVEIYKPFRVRPADPEFGEEQVSFRNNPAE